MIINIREESRLDKLVTFIVAIIWAVMVILRALDYVSVKNFRIILIVLCIIYAIFHYRNRIFPKKK